MTESTQLQTTENNNTGVAKMEPPPPLSTSPALSSGVDQHYHQQQRRQQQEQLYHHHQQLLQQKQQQQQQQQQYALKWNDFQSSILSSFRHLRDEEDFVDVTLACDERSFTAHKVVLSACSPYFRKLLKANPCEHPIVILRDVRSEDVENLLSFMYNGEVNVSQEQLTDFLKTANLLQVRGLADVNGSGSVAPMKLNSPSINNNSSISCNNHHNNNNNTNNNNNNNKNKSNLNNKLTFGGNLVSSSGGDTNLSSFLSSSTTTTTAPGVTTIGSATNSSTSLLTLASSLTTTTTTPATTLSNTPAVQELKASSSSSPVRKPINNKSNHHWDLSDSENNKTTHLTPPPQKRIKSADLFRAQHGISPERLLIDREFPITGQHPLTRERHRDRDRDRDCSRETSHDRSLELRDSLLSQALENSNGQQIHGNNMDQKQHNDHASLHAQSAGEDSNSSDTEPSDRGDGQLLDGTMDSMNGGGSLDNPRSHSFPSAFLGLQGIPGLLPGPSGIHAGANDFVSRRSLEMRVRATDPRPCPKCGKIYRSAHTLRTHLEDKHTICPGYRCVLCGTVAKSRNSLHSHMSRQHRGISTKDLPVLPMPSAFDPELASRLLAKAGVKISPAELRARASPTSGNGSNGGGGGVNSNGGLNGSNSTRHGSKLDLHTAGEDDEDDDDDPEDLTTGNGGNGGVGYGVNSCNSSNNDLSRYHDNLLGGFSHANTTITRIRNEAAAAAAAVISQKNDLVGNHIPTTTTAGQSLLDTYLQFITENTFGMGMTQEHAAAAALHAAKMAQLNAIGHHGLDKIPSALLAPQFDLSKIAAAQNSNHNKDVTSRLGNNFGNSSINNSGLTIEPILRRDHSNNNTSSTHENGPITPTTLATQQTSIISSSTTSSSSTLNNLTTEIRRDSSEPMDLGLDNQNQSASGHSECDENYSEDEGVHNT